VAIAKIRVPVEDIGSAILVVRGQRVLLDDKLAALYGVSTARLNQQVRRNRERFPADFLFELTHDEYEALMLQIATSKRGRSGGRKLPLVFTEHGAIMAANVLNSHAGITDERPCRPRLRQNTRDRPGVQRASRKDY